MIVRSAACITDLLLREEIIDIEDRDIYLYGLELIVSTIITLIITVIMGGLLHSLLPAICYFFALATLRTQAGGYHATSYWNCDALYTVLLFITLLTVKMLCEIPIDSVIPLLIIIIDVCAIARYAPVLCKKKMDQEEQMHAKRKAVIRGILWGILMVVLQPYIPSVAYTVLVTVTIVTIFMLIGRMKERKDYEKKCKENSIKRSGTSI